MYWTDVGLKAFLYMDHVKRKGVFEHAQNAQIQIHPAHAHNFIRTFVLHWYILLCQTNLLADSEGPDQTPRRAGWSGPSRITHVPKACVRLVGLMGNKLAFSSNIILPYVVVGRRVRVQKEQWYIGPPHIPCPAVYYYWQAANIRQRRKDETPSNIDCYW